MHMALQITPLQIQRFTHGTGFEAFGIRGADALLDPFLMIDHYRMSQPTFGPHPHAGFSAVTYMFDDAETGFINRDSLGPAQRIAPGAAHWSIAGAGIVHDEVPEHTGKTAHGLQLFVNLPAADELQPARALQIEPAQMARFRQASGALVKLGFGRYTTDAEHISVGELPSDVALFEVELQSANDRFEYALGADSTGIVIPLAGESRLNAHVFDAPAALHGDARLNITCTSPARFVLLTGRRIHESIFRHGPFALSSAERLRDAIARFQSGAFGSIQVDAASANQPLSA
jgi:redox-sensitive bicupin YhaK (pirin superfamily)